MRRFVGILSIGLTVSASAAAQTLTVACTDISGYRFDSSANEAVIRSGKVSRAGNFDTDRMSSAQYTISWQAGTQTATVTITGNKADSGSPFTETVMAIPVSDEQISFLSLYKEAVWMYSYFPATKRLLLTQHSDGVGSARQGTVGKLLVGTCRDSAR
jgi:hypothetical protein